MRKREGTCRGGASGSSVLDGDLHCGYREEISRYLAFVISFTPVSYMVSISRPDARLMVLAAPYASPLLPRVALHRGTSPVQQPGSHVRPRLCSAAAFSCAICTCRLAGLPDQLLMEHAAPSPQRPPGTPEIDAFYLIREPVALADNGGGSVHFAGSYYYASTAGIIRVNGAVTTGDSPAVFVHCRIPALCARSDQSSSRHRSVWFYL